MKHNIEVTLPEGAALVNATLVVVSYTREDGKLGYAVQAKGDGAPMTTYLGLTVLAQREIMEWGSE